MRPTYKEAFENKRNLEIIEQPNCYILKCMYRKKIIQTTSYDSYNVSNFRAKFNEIDKYGHNRRRAGYSVLVSEIIKANRF